MSETVFDPRMNQEPDPTLDVDAARRSEARIARAQRNASVEQPGRVTPRSLSDLEVQLASAVSRAIAAGDIEGVEKPKSHKNPDSLDHYPAGINPADQWMSGEA